MLYSTMMIRGDIFFFSVRSPSVNLNTHIMHVNIDTKIHNTKKDIKAQYEYNQHKHRHSHNLYTLPFPSLFLPYPFLPSSFPTLPYPTLPFPSLFLPFPSLFLPYPTLPFPSLFLPFPSLLRRVCPSKVPSILTEKPHKELMQVL